MDATSSIITAGEIMDPFTSGMLQKPQRCHLYADFYCPSGWYRSKTRVVERQVNPEEPEPLVVTAVSRAPSPIDCSPPRLALKEMWTNTSQPTFENANVGNSQIFMSDKEIGTSQTFTADSGIQTSQSLLDEFLQNLMKSNAEPGSRVNAPCKPPPPRSNCQAYGQKIPEKRPRLTGPEGDTTLPTIYSAIDTDTFDFNDESDKENIRSGFDYSSGRNQGQGLFWKTKNARVLQCLQPNNNMEIDENSCDSSSSSMFQLALHGAARRQGLSKKLRPVKPLHTKIRVVVPQQAHRNFSCDMDVEFE